MTRREIIEPDDSQGIADREKLRPDHRKEKLMAYWTIIGTGIDGAGTNKSFGVTLDTDGNTWIANGPSVDLFFKTKKGGYRVEMVPERGARLEGRSGDEVAFFTNLTGLSDVGAIGNGRASEMGFVFTWTLQSK